MKASDVVAEILAEEGVPVVFELIGGMITHLIDSIHQAGNIRLVSVHHEQAAAFAADAVGRLTGIPGVAMATSGPGATNLLTGIGSCYFDSSPAVFITGQVNRNEQKGNRAIRQLGFQETDIVSMAKPITKWSVLVNEPSELPTTLRKAFAVAKEGRPGPVLVDIPMDVQRADIDLGTPLQQAAAQGDDGDRWSHDLLEVLSRSERPLVVAGGGVRAADALCRFREAIHRLRLPTVFSLNAVDVLPSDDELRVGMLGSYGNRWANLALGEADVLLVLGSRLDIRQTGADTKSWKGDREVFHVDCEAGELNHRIEGCATLRSDLRPALQTLLAAIPPVVPDRSGWLGRIRELKRQWPDTEELRGIQGINPNRLMHQIAAAAREAATYLVDVGQHQMWAGQSIDLLSTQRFLTSGGMGSMGFSLPAAVGAASIGRGPAVVIAGDGGFQCNIQELQTVARNKLPIKIVIVNNECHGMVRQFQESYFDARYQSTLWGYSAPDFARVAEAYGIPAATVDQPEEVESALATLFADPTSPGLLQVKVAMEANAYPKIAFGHAMTEMEPHAKPLDMEGT
jgi:acetolactate synthase-1/2/3 large subunit